MSWREEQQKPKEQKPIEQTLWEAAKSRSMGHDPATEHERHPSVDRQNEGIEDAADCG